MTPISTSRDAVARMASDPVLWAAWSRVAAGSGLAGADGVTVAEFGRDLGPRLTRLARRLEDGDYQAKPLRPIATLRGGKARTRAVPTVADRVVQRAFLQVCAPVLADRVEASFAYRPGRSWLDAVARAQRHRDEGLEWVLRTDIEDFFATIDHTGLRAAVAARIPDLRVRELVDAWATAPLLTIEGLVARRRGLPEGAPASPLLAEVYLADLDHAIHRRHGKLVRYADDISVFCTTPQQALTALATIEACLGASGMRLNPDKTYIASFTHGFTLLGWHFQGTAANPATPPDGGPQ